MKNYNAIKDTLIKKKGIISGGREALGELKEIVDNMPDGSDKEKAYKNLEQLKARFEAGSTMFCGGPVHKNTIAESPEPEKAE